MLMALMLVAMSSGQEEYAKAYRAAERDGLPLVVQVGANWCPACVRTKRDVISKLTNCHVVVLDYDENPGFARKFMRGNTIPQTVIYVKGMSVRRFVGYQSFSVKSTGEVLIE